MARIFDGIDVIADGLLEFRLVAGFDVFQQAGRPSGRGNAPPRGSSVDWPPLNGRTKTLFGCHDSCLSENRAGGAPPVALEA